MSSNLPFFSSISPITKPIYTLWIFLSLNNDVNSWAYFLFFATIKTPVVSLSILWTEKGIQLSNSFVALMISIIFLFALVPDWTGIPAGLLITAKFSLFSTNRLLEKDISLFDGLYTNVLFFVTFAEKSKL